MFIPVIFAGQFFNSMYQYTASQDVVQRYQTTPSIKATAKSLWTNGWLAIVTILVWVLSCIVITTRWEVYQKVLTLVLLFHTL